MLAAKTVSDTVFGSPGRAQNLEFGSRVGRIPTSACAGAATNKAPVLPGMAMGANESGASGCRVHDLSPGSRKNPPPPPPLTRGSRAGYSDSGASLFGGKCARTGPSLGKQWGVLATNWKNHVGRLGRRIFGVAARAGRRAPRNVERFSPGVLWRRCAPGRRAGQLISKFPWTCWAGE